MTILNKKYLKKININIFIIFSFFFISQSIFAQISDEEKHNLFLSIDRNNIDKLKHFLEQGGDPNLRIKHQASLLEIAIRCKNLEAVKLLLRKGADIKLTNSHGDTPVQTLMHSSQTLLSWPMDLTNETEVNTTLEKERKKDIEILKVLLDAGANPDKNTSSGLHPLSHAAHKNRWDLVTLLLQKKADPFFKVYQDPMEFMKGAIMGNHKEVVQLIINNDFFSKKISLEQKEELLSTAIRYGSASIIPVLMASRPKFSPEKIKSTLGEKFLSTAVEAWIANLSIETDFSKHFMHMMAFTSLLFWYRYETHHLQKNFNSNFQEHLPQKIKDLLEKVNLLNNTISSNHEETQKILGAGKNIIDWIINHRFTGNRPEEFFKEFAEYLFAHNHQSQYEKMLLAGISYDLILKEYFLNPTISNKADFFKLKQPSRLNDSYLAKVEAMKADLRLMYAKELKDRFLFFTPEVDVIKNSHLDPLNHLNAKSSFKNFSLLEKKENSMISYCQNTSSPLVQSISEDIRNLKNHEIAQWIKNISDGKETSRQFFTEIFLGHHNPNAFKNLHAFSEHLEHIIKAEGKDIHSNTIFSDKDILDFESKK